MTLGVRWRRGLRLSLAARFAAILGALVAIFAAGVGLRNRVVDQLLVSGPAYQRIAGDRALYESFSPATQVIDGAFVHVDELVDDLTRGDTSELARHVLGVESVRVEYLAAVQYWRTHPPRDAALETAMSRAAEPALAFFKAFDDQLLPSIEKRDSRAAQAVGENVLDPLFREHRDRVADVQKLALATMRHEEVSAAADAQESMRWLLVGTIGSLAALLALAWLVFVRSVIRPIRRAVAWLSAIGRGEYDVAIDHGRSDEIGEVFAAIDSMRRALQATTADLVSSQAQVRVSEERLALAMRGTDEGLWELDLETQSTYNSQRWLDILGYDSAEIDHTYRGFIALVHPDDVAGLEQGAADFASGKVPHLQAHIRLRHRRGHYVPVLSRGAMARSPDGKPLRLVGTILDLTELQEVRAALDVAERKYHDIVEYSPQGIYQTSLGGRPLTVNRAVVSLFGFGDAAEFMRATPNVEALYVDPARRQEFLRTLEATGSVLGFTARMRRKDGSVVWTANSARLVRDETGKVKCIEGFIEDVTSRHLQEETILHLATHDALTDLPNRRTMDEAITRAISRAQRGQGAAFLLIDLDNFKAINDSVGHPAGDRFLQAMGPLFRGVLRPSDLVARFGGDEFAVLLEGIGLNRATAIAEKIRETVGEFRFQEGSYTFAPTASIGVAIVEGAMHQQAVEVVSLADAALHAAKDLGKNRCVVYEGLTEREVRFTEASQWAARIKDALREERFMLEFQPIVRLSDGAVAFHEALVRMREPDGTIVPPGAFIPAAERFGLASAVDEWVVNTAIDAITERPGLRLCVNLSGASLGDELLLQRIERRLIAAKLAPRQLVFEITETAVVQDLMRTRRWMERLTRHGCGFALDDFGMGFSSFSYLRSLPVSEVKIDGSFIRTLDTDVASQAVVGAITTLAHALGKQVIAEWVENPRTAERIAALGVDYGQGYFWSAPTSLEESVAAPAAIA